jgi:PEP-CTERM motif
LNLGEPVANEPGSPGARLNEGTSMRTANEEAPLQDSGSRTKSSTVKLLQAAALALVLVPLGTVAIESSIITCSFGTGAGTCDVLSGYGSGTESGSSATYLFDPDGTGGHDYALTLTFDQINGDFDVTIQDFLLTSEDLTAKYAANFPNAVCVPIYDASLGSFCVEFDITAPDPGPDTWESSDSPFLGYQIDISWNAPTDPDFPGDTIRMLKDSGPTNGVYDKDITIPGSYFCTGICSTALTGDPGISGQDNDFSAVSVASESVPEPTGILLFTTGLAGLMYRRRVRGRLARRHP